MPYIHSTHTVSLKSCNRTKVRALVVRYYCTRHSMTGQIDLVMVTINHLNECSIFSPSYVLKNLSRSMYDGFTNEIRSEWKHFCSRFHLDKCQIIIKTSKRPPQRKWRNRLRGGVHSAQCTLHSYYLKRRSIRLNGLILQTHIVPAAATNDQKKCCEDFVSCDCFFSLSKVYIPFDTIMMKAVAVFFLIFHINPSIVSVSTVRATTIRFVEYTMHRVYINVQCVTFWSGFHRHILWA